MAEMYLTEKFQQSLENSSTSSINERDDTDDEEFQSAIDDRHVIILLTFMIWTLIFSCLVLLAVFYDT